MLQIIVPERYFYEFTWSTVDFLYFEEETKKTSITDINKTDNIEQENNLSKTDSGNESLHEKVYFVQYYNDKSININSTAYRL